MRRRLLIPETVQTSAMDCGPACLKALFAGFNTFLSYGRLREACQTDVDGTSIDTLEELALCFGMTAAQSMVPADLLLLPNSRCLPAIVVTLTPGGGTHFVVIWRVHGRWVQVMDPAAGRTWLTRRRLLKSLYLHEQLVPATAWEEWSHSEQFVAGLRERAAMLGVAFEEWADRAHQDAALRLALELHQGGHLKHGAGAQDFLSLCAAAPEQIPARYWAIRRDPDSEESVLLRGAVILTGSAVAAMPGSGSQPESLARVMNEPEPRLMHTVYGALHDCGVWLPFATGVALMAAASGTVIEALLFRGLLDLWRHLESTAQRCGAAAVILIFLLALLALDWCAANGLLKLGRHLETWLRVRFMEKIPRLGDRYFQSRLLSDMAYRAHSLQALRRLPESAGRCLQLFTGIVVTGVAILWVYPGSLVWVCASIVAACGAPLLFLTSAAERDLRFREHSASVSALYLDCLFGARAIQAHGAQQTMLDRQAAQLGHWQRAALRRQILAVRADAAQLALAYGCIVGLVYQQASIIKSPAGLLLLVFWALSIPQLGGALAGALLELPALRNLLLRFQEPIDAPDEDDGVAATGTATEAGARIAIENISIVVAGHTVLSDVNLRIEPGEHVAIIGTSGAGKSTLLGCLLGWYKPASGSIRVDEQLLDGACQTELRQQTAWIDPQVHLFGRTLFDNLRFGNESEPALGVGAAVRAAGLEPVLRRWHRGLQTELGEGGTMVSGGEGQRVRLGRALGRAKVRLALLDEPTRGLGRRSRRVLLKRLRRHFARSTLLCVTHDISDTLDFDRVLVIEGGRVIENGTPVRLRATPDSRYGQLLDAEVTAANELWTALQWRRFRMRAGRLTAAASDAA